MNDPVLLADKVGHSLSHTLKLLGLGLGASENKMKIRYRQMEMARKYHSDKNNQEVMGLTEAGASKFFKLKNNANMFL